MKGIITFLLIICLNGLIANAQADLTDYIQVVVEFTEANQNLEAIKLCDKLEKTYPKNPDIYYLRGINKYVLKEYTDALLDFDKTLELNPDYSDAYLYRAKVRKANKDYFGSMKDYNKAKDQSFSQTVTSIAGDMIRSLFSGKD